MTPTYYYKPPNLDRKQIGLVSQEPILFASANIAENISYGVTGATREQIVAAAKGAWFVKWKSVRLELQT